MLDDWQDLADFKAFVKSLELEHFNYFEILTGVFKKRGDVINEPPPKNIWHNIGPSILVLDELRKHYDVAITINSAYRDPGYNAKIPGARRIHGDREEDVQCGSWRPRAGVYCKHDINIPFYKLFLPNDLNDGFQQGLL